VGLLGQTQIVCLPGPHDEVVIAWPALMQAMKSDPDKTALADQIAGAIRQKFVSRGSPLTKIDLSSHSMEEHHGSE
jgi:hypothetical protein